MSDIPWLVVAGALGLLVESMLRYSGVAAGSPWWVVPARGALAAGGVCGWLAFRFGRAFPGALLGGAAGGVAALLPPLLLPMAGVHPGPVSIPLAAGLVAAWALLPLLTHTLVIPLLSIAPVRRLVAHHPRWAHLRSPPGPGGP